MRDPARIEPTLKMIEILWKRNPDMRLGQLIKVLDGPDEDLWNLEDDVLQFRIAHVLAGGWDDLYKRLRSSDTEVAPS